MEKRGRDREYEGKEERDGKTRGERERKCSEVRIKQKFASRRGFARKEKIQRLFKNEYSITATAT